MGPLAALPLRGALLREGRCALLRIRAPEHLAHQGTLERLEALAEEGRLAQALLPVDEALREWPSLSMDSGAIDRLLQGQRVAAPGSLAPGHVRLYEDRRGFAGVVEACQDGSLVPRRMFPALRGKSPTAQAK